MQTTSLKTCTKCKESKELNRFYIYRRSRDGFDYNCKDCRVKSASAWSKANKERRKGYSSSYYQSNKDSISVYAEKWRHENPQRIKQYSQTYAAKHPEKIKERRLKYKYGLSLDEYVAIHSSQGGACAICGSIAFDSVLVVDHDHATGEVRGLLCDFCNKGLGMFKDSTESLAAAVKYLTKI